MRSANVWLSSCVVCGASIENKGSGRPRTACSRSCRKERKRRTASRHYRAKRGESRRRNRISLPPAHQRYRYRDELIILEEKLRRGSCLSCGLLVTDENHGLFDFDHRHRFAKRDNVSRLKGRSSSTDALVEEMSKCDLLCCLCHRRKTMDERDFVPTDRLVLAHPTLFDN